MKYVRSPLRIRNRPSAVIANLTFRGSMTASDHLWGEAITSSVRMVGGVGRGGSGLSVEEPKGFGGSAGFSGGLDRSMTRSPMAKTATTPTATGQRREPRAGAT